MQLDKFSGNIVNLNKERVMPQIVCPAQVASVQINMNGEKDIELHINGKCLHDGITAGYLTINGIVTSSYWSSSKLAYLPFYAGRFSGNQILRLTVLPNGKVVYNTLISMVRGAVGTPTIYNSLIQGHLETAVTNITRIDIVGVATLEDWIIDIYRL